MATKTFKIGLSDTDKQNMAQDVYERLIDMCFDEYDSTNTYNEGDFVVYNDVLYKCKQDNVTGTWDSSKWETATFQDLIDDVNEAVASVNGKANTEDLLDGSLVPNKSKFAENLVPVSKESGEIQEQPFISQGTGTDNGINAVDTGSTAQELEKQGATYCVNQLCDNGVSTTTSNGITLTNNGDGSYTFSGTASAETTFELNTYSHRLFTIVGHKYLLSAKGLTGQGNQTYDVRVNGLDKKLNENGVDIVIGECQSSSNYVNLLVRNGIAISTPITIKVQLIDLTQWFNGDVPQDIIDHPEHFSWYHNYGSYIPYNTGSLVSGNGRYLVTTERNIYNPEETYNIIIPNTTYFASKTTTLTYYDKDKNVIDTENVSAGNTFVTPSNCVYINSSVASITITVYYTSEQGGEGYLDNGTPIEYPYEEPKVYDTGTEPLLSTGVKFDEHGNRTDVHDVKLPSGLITHNVSVETLDSDKAVGSTITISGIKSDTTNISCKYGILSEWGTISGTTITLTKALSNGDEIYYEKATPTTTQGTPYPEDIEINDYGMTYWLDTDNNLVFIPQGSRLFYPAWYAGFIDSIGSKVNWNADNVVDKDELSAVDTKHDGLYAIMQENIGGALRHQLAESASIDFENTAWVDLGSLNWTYDSTNLVFYCDNLPQATASSSGLAHLICSKYGTGNVAYAGSVIDKTITNQPSTAVRLFVKDTSYTDATAFKTAMKGMLLAYEKA